MPKTPIWSDGIHLVRHASPKDRHKMRFVVGPHKTTASTYKRHAPSEAEAISAAEDATKRWLAQHPADVSHLTVEAPTLPAASSTVPKVKLQKFAITLFNCIYANPVAQVWKCTAHVGEKTAGRRKADGKPAEQTPIYHLKGQCAVLCGQTPVRTPDGRVRIFHTWGEAEEFAVHLYEIEPEENTISWKHPSVRVAATENVEVHFNPGIYGDSKPFVLWLPKYNRLVYEDRNRPPHSRATIPASKFVSDPQKKLDIEEARRRERRENAQPSFEERPIQFASIWGALEEAERRERMLRGETVR